MRKRNLLPILLAACLMLSGCGAANGSAGTDASQTSTLQVETTSDDASDTVEETTDTSLPIDRSNMFTERDYDTSYDSEDSIQITLSGSTALCDSDAVQIDGGTLTITQEGTYLISGTLEDGMILINAADTAKVHLLLQDAQITNSDSAAIYVRSADKVFITTAEGTTNTLTNGGSYIAIDENNIDAVIFSKADLSLNGLGNLVIEAAAGHGIVSKDDLVLTSGSYQITAASHGLSGKDSLRIAGGSYTITAGEDGLHAAHDDDTEKGFMYIADGSFEITAGDDALHASSTLVIDDGDIHILESYEGIEGLSIYINGGTIDLKAEDDGLNAAGGSDSSGSGGHGGDMFSVTEGACINISGGSLQIDAEGDGIDSNGDLYISGGEICIAGPTGNGNGILDYNGSARISGGTLLASGSSGMAQNFDADSTQGVILANVTSAAAGSQISLQDSSGNTLVSWEAAKSYSCVIISCPALTEGNSYTLTTEGTDTPITMDSLVYGSGMGGGRGGSPGGPGRNARESDMPPGSSDGESPTPSDNIDATLGTPPADAGRAFDTPTDNAGESFRRTAE